jgi:hypothetical protein
MKAIFFAVVILSAVCTYGQTGYPTPPSSDTRLFYIQHSDNYNTYVYDAKMKDTTILVEDPLDIYRIVYTEGGKKKPLSGIQRKMAYGMEVRYLARNSFEMNLAASKKLKFYLILNSDTRPAVYINVNNRKMYLDKMFIKIKDGSFGLRVKAEYVLFTGKDFSTGEPVTEKVVPKG